MGRKKSVDKTIDLEAEVVKATRLDSSAARRTRPTKGPKAEAPAFDEANLKELEPQAAKSPIVDLRPKVKIRKKRSQKVRSKKYTQLLEKLQPGKIYGLHEAIELCQKNSLAKFDGSLELHLNLNLDAKDESQKVRASLNLPHGTGKKVRVMAFVAADKAEACLAAGADFLGDEKTIEQIASQARALDFDKVVATPDYMARLTKIAKILGPKGLMPSPKTGTVSLEPQKAILEIKKGRLEVKMDPIAPVIHLGLGKLSFPAQNLEENLRAALSAIKEARPPKAPVDFFASAFLAPTMGPSVRIDLEAYK